jgi:hypothetical protein
MNDTSAKAITASAINANGVHVHQFEDGSTAVSVKGMALHLLPDEALALQSALQVLLTRQPQSVLEEARSIVYGDREKTHGEPAKNLRGIAQIWSAILGDLVTPEQVCLMLIGLKVARATNQPRHRDHWTDIVGYVALAERCGYIPPKEQP